MTESVVVVERPKVTVPMALALDFGQVGTIAPTAMFSSQLALVIHAASNEVRK